MASHPTEPSASGFVDLHCHYLPGIDDGVRTTEEGVTLLRGLFDLGFGRVVATPHIRPGMFDNRAPGIRERFDAFSAHARAAGAVPELGLGAEHFFDDVVHGLLMRGEAVPYPGGHAVLIELPERAFPKRLAQHLFEVAVKGIRPVLAHPERYAPLHDATDDLDALLDVGVLPLLDVMSLVGKYGRAPKRAAERMLDEGVYFAACSDVHKPADLEHVASGIVRLEALVGREEAAVMLSEAPAGVFDGIFPD